MKDRKIATELSFKDRFSVEEWNAIDPVHVALNPF